MKEEIKMSKLLIALKNHIKSDDDFICMCISIIWMDLDNKERSRVKSYLQKNNPKRISYSYFWWDEYVKKPRIKWLTEQIKELKSKGL